MFKLISWLLLALLSQNAATAQQESHSWELCHRATTEELDPRKLDKYVEFLRLNGTGGVTAERRREIVRCLEAAIATRALVLALRPRRSDRDIEDATWAARILAAQKVLDLLREIN